MDERALVSKAVYIMKTIAIITVAMAHCTYIDADIQRVTDIFGTIGVPIFLITGGLFYSNSRPLKDFMISKLKRIIVPWLFWGVSTYFLHILSNLSSLSLIELFKWIIGYKTWLYYVPVVLICYLVFRISTSTSFAGFVLLMSIGSYILTITGILDLEFITNCQNPLNWIGFFAIGIILNNNGFCTHIFLPERKGQLTLITGVLFVVLVISYYCLCVVHGLTPSYWNGLSVCFELEACIFIYYISIELANLKHDNLLLVDIGKNSYPLFFSHMQIGMNVINILCFSIWNKMSGVFCSGIVMVRGILVILISYFMFVFLIKRILKLFNLEKIGWVIGIL